MNLKWFILRVSVIFLIIGIVFDIELLIIFLCFFFLHVEWGACSIFFDYVHHKKINYFFSSLSKVLLIESIIQITNFIF